MSDKSAQTLMRMLELDSVLIRNKYKSFKLVHSGVGDKWYFAAIKEHKLFGFTYWPNTIWYAVWYEDRRDRAYLCDGHMCRESGTIEYEGTFGKERQKLITGTREFMEELASLVIEVDKLDRIEAMNIKSDIYFEKVDPNGIQTTL